MLSERYTYCLSQLIPASSLRLFHCLCLCSIAYYWSYHSSKVFAFCLFDILSSSKTPAASLHFPASLFFLHLSFEIPPHSASVELKYQNFTTCFLPFNILNSYISPYFAAYHYFCFPCIHFQSFLKTLLSLHHLPRLSATITMLSANYIYHKFLFLITAVSTSITTSTEGATERLILDVTPLPPHTPQYVPITVLTHSYFPITTLNFHYTFLSQTSVEILKLCRMSSPNL